MKTLKNTLWAVGACLFFCYAIFGSTALAMEYNIAHITQGEAMWEDTLIIDNMGDATVTFNVVLYNGGTQVVDQPYAIASMATTSIDLKQLSSQADCGVVVAPNTTTLPTGIIFLRFRLRYVSTDGGIAEFELSPMNKSQLAFNFSDEPTVIDWKGLAVMNTDTTTSAPVKLYAIYGNGNLSLPVSDTVPANGKLVGMHTKWFPSISVDDIQSIIISSVNSSLCGICISGRYDNSRLLFTQAGDASLFRETDIATRYMVDSKLLEGNWVFNVTYVPAGPILEYSYYINKLTTATNIEGGYVIGGLNMYVPTPPLVAREVITAQRWPSTGNFTLTDTTDEEIPGSTVRRVYTFTLDNVFTETDYYSVTGTVIETVGAVVTAGTFTGRQVNRIINNNPDVDQ